MTTDKAVICLGAGPSQLLVINTAKVLGLRVIAVDHNPDAVGFSLADERLTLSTYEAEPIIEASHKLHYNIQGVINRSSGPPVVTAARISQELNLPGILPQAAEILTNKAFLISACNKFGISAPRNQFVRSLDDVNWTNYPAVIKPAMTLVGKRSIYLVRSYEELSSHFVETQASSYDGRVEIEEFVLGQDTVLVSMVSKGRLLPVVLLDEINEFDKDGALIGGGFAVPSILSKSTEEKAVHTVSRQIISAFGLDTTPLFVNCRCPNGRPAKVIEVHLDLAGDWILDKLLPTANADFDFMSFAIKIMMGQQVEVPSLSFSAWRTVVEGSSPQRLEPYNE